MVFALLLIVVLLVLALIWIASGWAPGTEVISFEVPLVGLGIWKAVELLWLLAKWIES